MKVMVSPMTFAQAAMKEIDIMYKPKKKPRFVSVKSMAPAPITKEGLQLAQDTFAEPPQWATVNGLTLVAAHKRSGADLRKTNGELKRDIIKMDKPVYMAKASVHTMQPTIESTTRRWKAEASRKLFNGRGYTTSAYHYYHLQQRHPELGINNDTPQEEQPTGGWTVTQVGQKKRKSQEETVTKASNIPTFYKAFYKPD